MMDKILVTQEQFDSLEYTKRLDKDYGWLLEAHVEDDDQWVNKLKGFNGMSLGDLAKALYTEEYEVMKPQYKNGDKFVYVNDNSIGTFIDEVVYWSDKSTTDVRYLTAMIEEGSVRFATEEDIYWLENLGRNSVPDFRKHDIYVDGGMDAWLLGKDIAVDKAHAIYQKGDFLGVYPVESFKSFYEGSQL